MYEINANNGKMCTGVLFSHNNSIYHSRNLDYGFAEALADMTVQLRFMKHGKHTFTIVGQAGFLGAHTGLAPGRFAVNINERAKGSPLRNIWGLFRGKWSVTRLLRYALEYA